MPTETHLQFFIPIFFNIYRCKNKFQKISFLNSHLVENLVSLCNIFIKLVKESQFTMLLLHIRCVYYRGKYNSEKVIRNDMNYCKVAGLESNFYKYKSIFFYASSINLIYYWWAYGLTLCVRITMRLCFINLKCLWKIHLCVRFC